MEPNNCLFNSNFTVRMVHSVTSARDVLKHSLIFSAGQNVVLPV